jgi:hypothetical protein
MKQIVMADGLQSKSRHHFVPRSYLRAFADADERMLTILREPFEVRGPVHTRNVAAEHGFYKVRRADGSLSDAVEDDLAVFDGTIPAIVRNVTSGKALNKDRLDGMRRLYAVMATRSHLGRDYIIADVEAMLRRAEQSYDVTFPDGNPEERDRLVDQVMREVWDQPDEYATDAETISRATIITRANKIMSGMPRSACIIRAPQEIEFFTSDTPHASFDAKDLPLEAGVYGSAFSAPLIELTMPLDRRHAVLFANVRLPFKMLYADAAAATIINSRTLFFAKRMIFTFPSDEAVATALATLQVYRERYLTPLLAALPKAV